MMKHSKAKRNVKKSCTSKRKKRYNWKAAAKRCEEAILSKTMDGQYPI